MPLLISDSHTLTYTHAWLVTVRPHSYTISAWIENGSLEAIAAHTHSLRCLELGRGYGVRDEGLLSLCADGACLKLGRLYLGHTQCSPSALSLFQERRPHCVLGWEEHSDWGIGMVMCVHVHVTRACVFVFGCMMYVIIHTHTSSHALIYTHTTLLLANIHT